jgi:glutamyl-tRNA synthetase
MSLRVRFAPSPTGYLHLGGARTALFNWLLARRHGGTFVLRIEDTDRARSSEAMVRAILDGMRWLGLDWDEGPYFQGEGSERHQAAANRLLQEGKAYRDFTTAEELARLRAEDPDAVIRFPRERAEALSEDEAEYKAARGEPHAVRFRVPPGRTSWEDRVHGEVSFDNADIEDLVILRTDGSPTYNLAAVSDDADMGITLILRGDDHVSNTPKQVLLHEALGHRIPDFAHVPLILGPDGKRLSKRHGATAVGDYEGRGILPEAMVNFLALLGWSPGTDEEVLTPEELAERFSLDRVVKKSAIFDPEKLAWLNGQHLSRLTGPELAERVRSRVEALGPGADARLDEDPEWFATLMDLLKTRARSLDEVVSKARPYLLEEIRYDPDAVKKHWARDPEAAAGHLEALRTRLGDGLAAEEWREEALEHELRALAEERGVGAGKLIHPLRLALVGEAVSPGIFEVLEVMGRDRSLARMAAGVAWIRAHLDPE